MDRESGIFLFENKDGTIGIVVKFGGKIGVGTKDKKKLHRFQRTDGKEAHTLNRCRKTQ